MAVASPTHTSSHYQTFETPLLHELVGGDRNMEQNNLVVTPDGKTWDEVTRDTSYMGSQIERVTTNTAVSSSTAMALFDDIRGRVDGNDQGQKNFTIAFDRLICLKEGMYEIMASTIKKINNTYHCCVMVNGVARKRGHSTNIDHDTITTVLTIPLKRHDYVQLQGGWYQNTTYGHFHIRRVEF